MVLKAIDKKKEHLKASPGAIGEIACGVANLQASVSIASDGLVLRLLAKWTSY